MTRWKVLVVGVVAAAMTPPSAGFTGGRPVPTPPGQSRGRYASPPRARSVGPRGTAAAPAQSVSTSIVTGTWPVMTS